MGTQKKRALIIGAAGFVGPYLAEAVARDMGCDVTVTRLAHESAELPGAKTVQLNILDPAQLDAVLVSERPDYIFHLAAQSSVARSWQDPASTVRVNVLGAVHLLEAVRKLDYRPRVLIVGSGEEYGRIQDGGVPVKEDAALHPGNIYAVTKACQNMLASVYAQAYGMELVMVRAFNHIGPRQTAQFVVADFCSQAAKIEKGAQESVIRVGNLSAKRDFTDVRDVVRAYTALIQRGRSGETYNVGSGHAVAIQDILDMILSQAAVPIRVEVDTQKLRPVDVPVIEADTTKIFRDTGWRPEIPLERTIADTLQYWRENIE